MNRLSFLLAAVVMVATGCGEPEPIRIGFLGGISGRVADLGVAGRNGAVLAVELKNAEGGIDGRRVELLVRDDEQDAEKAKERLRELAGAGAAAVIGPMTSSIAVAIVPVANEIGIALVSPTVTTNALTGLDDQFFRVLSATREYAAKSAIFQRERHHVSTVSAIVDRKNAAYTESWLADFRASFETAGGRIVLVGKFDSGSESLSPVVSAALAVKTDALLIVANSVDAAMIAQQVRKVDKEIPLIGSEWAATERLIELGGASVEGMTIAQFVDRDSDTPGWRDFSERFRRRFGEPPGFSGLAGFDATNVVLDALAQTNRPDKIAEVLKRTARFRGVQAPVVFDPFGDAHRPSLMTRIVDGRFVRAE